MRFTRQTSLAAEQARIIIIHRWSPGVETEQHVTMCIITQTPPGFSGLPLSLCLSVSLKGKPINPYLILKSLWKITLSYELWMTHPTPSTPPALRSTRHRDCQRLSRNVCSKADLVGGGGGRVLVVGGHYSATSLLTCCVTFNPTPALTFCVQREGEGEGERDGNRISLKGDILCHQVWVWLANVSHFTIAMWLPSPRCMLTRSVFLSVQSTG